MTSFVSKLKDWLQPSTDINQLMLDYAYSGDSRVLTQLVKCCGDDLYHYLLSQTDTALAADISQQTWLKVMQNRQQYKKQGQFKSWLFCVARHLLIDELRRQQRWKSDENVDPEHVIASSAEQTNRDLERAFHQALQALPFLQREAFILQQEGFSLSQIESITGDGRETIKSRLRYARQIFKQQLGNSNDNAN